MTPEGEVAAEALKVGDRVLTLDSDAQVIKWIGSKRMSWFDLIANPKLYPVRVRKNALGSGMPDRDLHVSPQHRILVRSKVAQRVLGVFLKLWCPPSNLSAIQELKLIKVLKRWSISTLRWNTIRLSTRRRLMQKHCIWAHKRAKRLASQQWKS